MNRFRLVLALIIVLTGTLMSNDLASAANDCQISDNSYTAATHVVPGRYTVYARFGKASQQGDVTLTGMTPAAACLFSGTTALNGSSWSQIATFDSAGATVTFDLQSPLLATLPDANRPLIMLVSQDNPACTVDTTCHATAANQTATLQSPDVAEEHGALRILIPQPLSTLRVTRVNYYADNVPMYSTPRLEQFDTRMIPYYATHTSRVIVYDNGQQATLAEALPYAHSDGPSQFVYRLWRQHEGIITALTIAVSILVLQQLIKLVIYLIYRERRWRYAHGFLRDHLSTFSTNKERRVAAMKFIAQKAFSITEKVLTYGLIISVIVFGTLTFIVKVTRVDGESMSPTLVDSQLVYVNMFPVSLAHLNHSTYSPKRGDLVAARPLFGTVAVSKNTDELIVKRVVGLPNERVTVVNNTITIYNAAHPEGFNPDSLTEYPYTVTNDETSQVNIDITLTGDEIFICGDNRPVSIDSRDNGAITTSQVIGIVQGFPFGIQ